MPGAAPALSTHAVRNQTRAVKPTRKRGKSGASNNSNKVATEARAAARVVLEADVEEHYEDFQAKVTTLSIKHGKKERYIRKLLSNGTQYKKRRALNIRNAIVHDLSLKAKDGACFWRVSFLFMPLIFVF